ncbi:holo-ACP synthase [Dinghuibacter silviterrae]|uniref:Holo-[acyl-carrier-protein] synthase n=1 Tax=Dinghuibacter silviterrae TaxID=1539049 RepID=A0A4V3GM67_9BACT|nr:holo-ACP synthase [Dinghuibacter silviterrae]TDX02293.1 holo-[acyl-carrier-protein] synthase [Dinghuibacter silviterrae]
MIHGLGIDLIEVDRVAARIGKEQGFRELVFSPGEIAYCSAKAHPAEHYAARFAAKEAFFKALGTGWATGTAFNEVEVLPDPMGAPKLTLLGDTAATVGDVRIRVSLTHLSTMAAAVVVIEK